MLFADSSWICLRPRAEDVLVELEAHAEERAAAGDVFTSQVGIMKANQVVSGGDPHISDQAIAGFKSHAILARAAVQAANSACSHADVPLAREIVSGAASY